MNEHSEGKVRTFKNNTNISWSGSTKWKSRRIKMSIRRGK